LLDEVHLSRPFLETLEAIRHYRTSGKTQLPDRWQFVAMSATPGTDTPAFGLADDDRQNAQLARRLRAAKPVEHGVVKVSGSEPLKRTKFAEECAKRIDALATAGRAVGVVVNRVATALEIFKLVTDLREDARVFLVTGRMRPLDRNDLDAEVSKLVSSGRVRDAKAPPIIVVATQCIEAGADFDFDCLVTECASLDALRQRFGRLNRLGEISDARGVVLVRSDAIDKGEDDPVYGPALDRTWQWIQNEPRDFGIHAMDACLPKGDELAGMLPRPSRAPVMLPAHLDAWTQTTPIPRPDPDVSLWLHGVDQKPDADVQIVWRCDVSAALIARAEPRADVNAADARLIEAALDVLKARMAACAPIGLEALAVPIGAARAWLAGTATPDVADIEGRSPEEPEEERDEHVRPRAAFLWKGEDSVVLRASDMRPGMTLVVPCTYGGLACGTWDPSSTAPVDDLGDRARWEQTRRPTLRLHPALKQPGWPPLPEPANDDEPDDDERKRVTDWLTAMESASLPKWLSEVVAELKRTKRYPPALLRLEGAELAERATIDPSYLCLVARRRARGGTDVSTEDDGASHTGVEVTLNKHMEGVCTLAGHFATRCGLPEALIHDLEIAGRWHDAGKVDPRFQRLLRGGSPLSDVAGEPLAKSRIVAADRATRMRALERSGYPKGARHELSSVSLLQQEESLLASASDRELVLHLVASHHGWCRPFAPVVEDREPVELTLDAEGVQVTVASKHTLAALDSGIPERFWRLVERYGWFGLAWLEAILRLADHRQSEHEQNSTSEQGVDT
jgi:CRISPR-associated endonuclease/helicase Cas3